MLELGAGTGWLGLELSRRWPKAEVRRCIVRHQGWSRTLASGWMKKPPTSRLVVGMKVLRKLDKISVELGLRDRSSCGAKRSQYAVSERGIFSTI